MIMLGAIVNTLTVLIGTIAGSLLKSRISSRICDTVFGGMALCVIYIGISGAIDGCSALSAAYGSYSILIVIISMAIGAALGEWINIERHINVLGDKLIGKFGRSSRPTESSLEEVGEKSDPVKGFVDCTLLFCIGSMTIIGALESGVHNTHDILIAKGVIDCVSGLLLASRLGWGCTASAVSVLVYEGGLTLLAKVIEPYLSESMIAGMSGVGSLILIAIGLNMLGVTKFRTANYIISIFLPVIMCLIFGLIV